MINDKKKHLYKSSCLENSNIPQNRAETSVGSSSLTSAPAEAADGGNSNDLKVIFPSSHPHKGIYFSLMLWHKRPRWNKSLCSPAERSHGDTRVAGCSSQGGGYPLLQSFPRPEPGAPHTADHNHTQDILLQTLSQNGNDSVMEHWILLIFFKTLGGVGSAL